jgi:hypothetical protein
MFFEPFEQGPIRPPSEAYSLLIRATRNCPWNRCRFCSTYKGNKFELRPVEDIKQDILKVKQIQDEIKTLALKQGYGINVRPFVLSVLQNPPSLGHYQVALWMQAGSQNVFLQDANTIIMRTPDLVEVLKFLKETLPTVNRITSYGRSHTAAHKTLDELKAIHEAGLSRLHIGLESGSDAVLKIMNKGVTAEQHIAGGRNVVASGISLSEYVLLGLGGQGLWRDHALETARVLSAINPDFIRIRTLGIYPGLEMYADVESGAFVRQSDEGMVEELRLIIENLDCTSNLVSDHAGNLLEIVNGKLTEDKAKMLGVIAQYQSMPPRERLHFRVGRRAGVYVSLDEMKDPRKHATVDGIIDRLSNGTGEVDDDLVHQMRLAYT